MPRNIIIAVAISAALALACSGADDSAPEAPASEGATAQAATNPHADPHSAPAAAGSLSSGVRNRGRVITAESASGYSYLQVEVGGKVVWLATKPIDVRPGEEIGWGDFAPMKNFTSKALGRTFDEILFVANVVPLSQQAAAGKQGRVLSSQTVAGYTYIEAESGGGTVWLAVPSSSVRVGDRITWSGGSTMRNFTSTSLSKTFDEIVFASGVQVID